jgi:hypothetical protein
MLMSFRSAASSRNIYGHKVHVTKLSGEFIQIYDPAMYTSHCLVIIELMLARREQ